MTPQFTLSSIQKLYGTRLALDMPELSIWPGRLYVLTGPNGSGKSTLLHILAFLTRPERGEVMFDGKPVRWKGRELNDLRKRVTLLHQTPYLFNTTVFDNVAYGLRLRGVSGPRLQQTVFDALNAVRLANFDNRKVTELSGGEIRRVALARALAVEPEILLLDEPLANLDQHSCGVIEQIVSSLPSQGTTVVMSTHDLQVCERLESDVIHLVDGRIEQAGGRAWDEVEVCPPLTMPAI